MFVVQAFSIPVIGALIGWMTNVLAIRLLFHPRKPYRLPLTQYEVQGLLPKRRAELARDIGQVVEKELLSLEDVFNRVNTPEVQTQVADAAGTEVVKRLKQSMPDFLPRGLVRKLEEGVHTWVQKEIPPIFSQVVSQVSGQLKEDIQVAEIVENKIQQFDLEQLEGLVSTIANRELRHIEWLGGVLGFFIGLVQVAFFYCLPYS